MTESSAGQAAAIIAGMSAPAQILYVFAISHYCEKARWALDHLGIEYDLCHVAPGEHGQIAKRLGAQHTHVPYLSVGEQVVQGSANIIDWADGATSDPERRLTPVTDLGECQRIEKRIDDIAGVHLRRYYYSEALVEHPQTVRPIFTRDLPLRKKLLITMAWGKIRKLMIARMDLGAEQGQESRDIVAGELDWVDEMFADGREYLVGNRLSRADIAVASLLSPLAMPAQHPTYKYIQHPPRLALDVAGWESRPSIQWVRALYEKHR